VQAARELEIARIVEVDRRQIARDRRRRNHPGTEQRIAIERALGTEGGRGEQRPLSEQQRRGAAVI